MTLDTPRRRVAPRRAESLHPLRGYRSDTVSNEAGAGRPDLREGERWRGRIHAEGIATRMTGD